MADTVLAQNLIVSVLEHAGYLTQERILERLSGFFDGTATILLIVAAIGGMFSMVLFGSYRMARHLILGPALYWVLIAPAGVNSGIKFQVGPDAAKDQRHIRVASAFQYYTRAIDGVTDELRKIVASVSDDPEFPFLGRIRAYEVLMNMDVENKELLEMIGLMNFSRCGEMMDASIALASPELLQYKIDSMRTTANGMQMTVNRQALMAEVDRIEAHRAAILQRRYRASKEMIRATGALQRFVDTKLASGADPAIQGQLKTIFEREGVNYQPGGGELRMTCEAAWNVTQQAIWESAGVFVDQLLGDFTGTADDKTEYQQSFASGTEADRRRRLCVELAHKLGQYQSDKQVTVDQATGAIQGDTCDLPAVAGVMLMRNAILKMDRTRRLQYHHDSMQMIAAVKDGTIVAQESDSSLADSTNPDELLVGRTRRLRLVGGMYNYKMRWVEGEHGGTGYLAAAFIDEAKPEAGEQWLPFKRVAEITGHFGAGFKEHQSYQTRGMRQAFFTIPSQLSYYQGYLLYLLAIGYPFGCLIVLMPGKAQNVFYLPLAWLWVRSWKIGFVLVDILDEVLWNMFPHTDLPFSADGGPIDQMELPNVLHQAFKVDPTFNVHAYYRLQFVAFGFVTAGSAYAILRSKRGILAAFTGALLGQGKDASNRAEGGYGVATMNKRLLQEKELVAAGKMAKVASEEAMRGQGREEDARFMGGMRGLATTVSGIPGAVSSWRDASTRIAEKRGGNFLSNPRKEEANQLQADKLEKTRGAGLIKNASNAIAGGIVNYNKTWMTMLDARLDEDAEYAAAFDPRFGRWGSWSMMSDATTAAMDAEGGFEINDQHSGSGAWKARVELASTRLRILIESGDEVAQTAIAAAISKVGNKALISGKPGRLVKNFKYDVLGANALANHFTGDGMDNSWSDWVYDVVPGAREMYTKPSQPAIYEINYGPKKVVPKEYFFEGK